MGWIRLDRKITDNWLWDEKPFSRGQAWIDLILMANHKDNKIPLGDEVITVARGDFITSELKLMDRWGWSKSKVRLFLLQLQNDTMIVKKSDHKKTAITIVNYGVYQDIETTEEPVKDHKKTSDRPVKDTNNNINNKTINNIYKDIVEYLNQKLGSAFKTSSRSTQKHINARLSDGYTQDDFKTVIDKKVSEWKNDEKMSQYLRPETLFGGKFEGYLNQKDVKPKAQPNKFNQHEQREYTPDYYADLEKKLLNKGQGG